MSGGAVTLMGRPERPVPAPGSKPGPRSKPSVDWLKRNGEANALAGYLYDHRATSLPPQAGNGQRSSENPMHEARCTKPDYQKKIILAAAEALGFRAQSRRELTPEQLGRISTTLRGMIEALGLPSLEQARDSSRAVVEGQEPTTSDWKQFTKVYSDLLASGWSDARFKAWLMKYHRRRTVRHLPAAQFRAVIRGIEGILKHGHGSAVAHHPERKSKDRGTEARREDVF